MFWLFLPTNPDMLLSRAASDRGFAKIYHKMGSQKPLRSLRVVMIALVIATFIVTCYGLDSSEKLALQEMMRFIFFAKDKPLCS
jgi:hypothetical protein